MELYASFANFIRVSNLGRRKEYDAMTYEELLKNRTPIRHLANSAHMMECIARVKEKYPDAEIVEIKGKHIMWKLMNGSVQLSNEHNSHYACWLEARKIIERM